MRILPVLDLMNGVVVRGVAGRRAEYRPVVSQLVASTDPIEVAEAFRAHFGFSEFYVADLDAIAGSAPALATYDSLLRRRFRIWVDAGVRTKEQADVLAAPEIGLVIGLETIAGPDALASIFKTDADRPVFSLDLRAGVPLGNRRAWDGATAWQIAERVIALGAHRLLLLDLARVGVGGGTGTEELSGRLIASYPNLHVWVGGGVRSAADLSKLHTAGVQTVLISSALHDGSVTARDLDCLPFAER